MLGFMSLYLYSQIDYTGNKIRCYIEFTALYIYMVKINIKNNFNTCSYFACLYK